LKAARNGGFSFISNGLRLLPMFIEITKITSFSKKCCQNVATEQALEQQNASPPAMLRERQLRMDLTAVKLDAKLCQVSPPNRWQ
jgi:hypothetical protein